MSLRRLLEPLSVAAHKVISGTISKNMTVEKYTMLSVLINFKISKSDMTIKYQEH